jgi:hypothetical protein
MPAEVQILQSIDRAFAAKEEFEDSADVACGPFRVKVSFATEPLRQAFLPSLIPRPAGPSQLDIRFTSASEIDLAAMVPQPPDLPRLVSSDRCYAVWQPGALPVLLALDRQTARGIVWLAADAAPYWMRSRPALALLHAFSVDTPWTALHGGAVGHAGRFALLAGKGRSGKTTAALSCALAGWDYAGDDFVFTHTQTGRIEPLYCSARLRADLVSVFGSLLDASAGLSDDDGEHRHELRLATKLTGRIGGGSMAAIFLPRRTGASTVRFVRARRSDVFASLLAITTIGLPGWPNVTAEKIAAVAGLAPAFLVDTGPDPLAIPAAFAAKLDSL